MNMNLGYMIIMTALIQILSFESIASVGEGNSNENKPVSYNNVNNCKPWAFRYHQLEQAAKQNLVITARHRGDFDLETPENSLGAFLNSYEKCRPSIETDLRLTKDGKVVLFHDLNVGKMTNPHYEPETGVGDNKALKELTLSELKNLNLVTINRTITSWKIPTLEDFLEHYVEHDPGTLVFLEVKEPSAMIKVINTVKEFDNKYPDKKLHDRLIIKYNIALYPTPDKWVEVARISGGDRVSLMANPVMSPYAAETLNKGGEIPEPEHKYNTNAEKSIYLWSKSEFHTAPVIEVVLKDSTEFIAKTEKRNEFGRFEIPSSLSETNAKDGTLAKMITIVKGNNKSLGVFVPIPDYNMWRDKLVTGYTVNNTFGNKEPILVDNAFFNNDSSCCYSLKDRRQSSSVASEIHDWRMNIEWQRSIGADIFTADDTDSIDSYFDSGEGDRPSPYMNSILSWVLKFVTHPVGAIVKMQAWNGSVVDWPWGKVGGSNVCLYLESHGAPSYGLVNACDDDKAISEGYNQYITLRNSAVFENKMEIYNYQTNKCLIIPNNTSDWAEMGDCGNAYTSQVVRYSDNRYQNHNGSLYMTFKFYGLWYGSSYGYAYSETKDAAIKDDWSQWLMMQ